jgi:hypothetical protein
MSQFSFKNVGHFFATVAGDIVKGARAVASVMLKAEKVEPEIEALSGIFFPQAVELERGAFALLGMARAGCDRGGRCGGTERHQYHARSAVDCGHQGVDRGDRGVCEVGRRQQAGSGCGGCGEVESFRAGRRWKY